MNKILIVGISGTGKTKLANELSLKLDLPVIHLDTIFWEDYWKERDPALVESLINAELRKDSWIIEGYIEPHSTHRIKAADLIIYLDYTGPAALLGGLQRWWKYKGRARPEMPEHNTEKFGYKFLLSLLNREERPEIEQALATVDEGKVIRLRTRREAKNLKLM